MAPSAVDDVEDKVTQDVDNSEGTRVWTNMEWAERHVPAPTIALAHCLRLATSNKGERLEVAKKLKIAQPKERVGWKGKTREEVEATLEKALYGASLASYAQGCNVRLSPRHDIAHHAVAGDRRVGASTTMGHLDGDGHQNL